MREDLNRDFLTGAYNRRYIETVLRRQLEADLAAGGRAAVALVSLDNADRLRYEHGQPALDQIICTIANQWKKHYDAPGSRIVCRLHGGVLLMACKGLDAAAMAREMGRYYREMPCDLRGGLGHDEPGLLHPVHRGGRHGRAARRPEGLGQPVPPVRRAAARRRRSRRQLPPGRGRDRLTKKNNTE